MENKKIYSIIAITAVLLTAIGVTFAYFAASVGGGATTNINAEAKTTDKLTFTSGTPVSILATQDNFGPEAGNLLGETTSSATLIANSNTNTASEVYNVYFNISENNYEYTTIAKTAELILTITDPSGAILNTLPGLSYVTVGSVSGFDITEYDGLIRISENQAISTTSSTTGTTQDWQATITFVNLNSDQANNQGKTFSGQLKLQKEEIIIPTLGETIITNNGGVTAITAKGNPNFAIISNTNEGMYAMADDYGTSYYFRGAVDNNWVKFADIYWRIVRVNGNNSVKLIYSGATAPTENEKSVMIGEGTQITTQAFNSNCDSAEYVGYMYTLGEQRGLGTASVMKTYLESWYSNNLASYDNKIADTIFCNDRSTYSGTINGIEKTGNGIGTINTWFGAARRLAKESSGYGPIGTGSSLICPHKDDAFTKLDTVRGNGKSLQKLGLLTADEVSVAGLAYYTNNNSNYLYTNNYYWLGSPSDYNNLIAFGMDVSTAGYIFGYTVNHNLDVRPVISLSTDISSSSGNGTWNNPYVIN
ncbi:MAG: hypothetical protein PHE29_10550 [Tissierellia bacterium]|nr:hypothetical protein [Tissierellia bacterium]